MIPTKEKIEEISNLPGEEVYATIGDPRMVMKSLTKLYSNTALATIREYSTNARDSNVEAGRSDIPIEVTLPTILNPYFIVKDTGIGLSEKSLKEIYVSYGTSTKRNSNDFNGMLGFGSKSALAYTNTFTVTAIKDGMRTIAVITRKPDYSVALKIVATAKTSEHNGVTIKVPVQDPQTFSRIAMDFYRFWTPGTILVDGKETTQAVGAKIDDNLYYSKNEGTSYVVMGNVGYRIANPEALFANKKMKSISFVAFVENGSVEFTPSREDLEYSDATKNTLNGVIENFEKKMNKAARDEISKAKDNFEAYSRWVEWGNRLGYEMFKDLDYGGSTFKKNVDLTLKAEKYIVNSWRRYNTEPVRNGDLTVAAVNSTGFIVSDMTSVGLNSNHKSKVKEYLKLNNISGVTNVYFLWESVDNQWVKPERIISWKDLLAALPKKPKNIATGGTGRIAGSFDYIDENSTWKYGQPLPNDGKVFYLTVQESKTIRFENLIRYHVKNKTKDFDKSVSVIYLGENRVKKFKRENPTIENFKDFCVSKVELDGEKFLTLEGKTALSMSEYGSIWTDMIEKFDDDRILDPEWKAVRKTIANKAQLLIEYNKAYQYAVDCGMRWKWNKFTPNKISFPFATRYPMLSKFGYNFPYGLKDDLVWYMNECYTRRVKTSV